MAAAAPASTLRPILPLNITMNVRRSLLLKRKETSLRSPQLTSHDRQFTKIVSRASSSLEKKILMTNLDQEQFTSRSSWVSDYE